MSEYKDQKCCWAIVLLIYADYTNDHSVKATDVKIDEQMERLFDDMERCNINRGVRVFTILNSIRYHKDGKAGQVLEDVTIVSEVTHDGPRNRTIICEKIDNLKSGGIGKLQLESNLSKLFEKINACAKPERIFLITWDHGSVFGIFKEFNPGRPPKVPPGLEFIKMTLRREAAPVPMPAFDRFLKQAGIQYESNPVSKGLSGEMMYKIGNTLFTLPSFEGGDKEEDDAGKENILSGVIPKSPGKNVVYGIANKGKKSWLCCRELSDGQENEGAASIRKVAEINVVKDILTNEELATAIEQGFGKKVDVLLMMNCWMSSVYTAHALQHWVKYLAAPQTSIAFPGYDYEKLINHTNCLTKAQDILQTCKQTLEQPDTQKYMPAEIKEITTWSVPFLNLKNYESASVSATINELAGLAVKLYKDKTGKFLLKSARRHSYLFSEITETTNYNMIDIYQWLMSVQHIRMDEILTAEISRLFSDLTNNIIKLIDYNKRNKPLTFVGKNAYEYSRSLAKVLSFSNSGLSIYFPENNKSLKDPWLKKIVLESDFMVQFPTWGLLLEKW